MKKTIVFLILLGCALCSAPQSARAQESWKSILLTDLNVTTQYPCGNPTGAPTTQQISASLSQVAYYGGGTLDLTCYQSAISLSADIFSSVSANVLVYLPEHAITVNANTTIPANFELCGGPGASIAAGGGFTLTNNATPCFNGFTSGGGGSSCTGTSGELLFLNGAACIGVPNSSVDPSTGDVTLGAAFNVVDNSSTGLSMTEQGASSFVGLSAPDAAGYVYLAGGDNVVELLLNGSGLTSGLLDAYLGSRGPNGILIDSTGAQGGGGGTGPTNLISAGGVSITDDSPLGINTLESATGGIQNLFQKWVSPGIDTLVDLTSDTAVLASEGYQALCSDCDTPLTEGAVCTSAGDMAGALALYIRGALLCF
jgi:hypothetical protein